MDFKEPVVLFDHAFEPNVELMRCVAESVRNAHPCVTAEEIANAAKEYVRARISLETAAKSVLDAGKSLLGTDDPRQASHAFDLVLAAQQAAYAWERNVFEKFRMLVEAQ